MSILNTIHPNGPFRASKRRYFWRFSGKPKRAFFGRFRQKGRYLALSGPQNGFTANTKQPLGLPKRWRSGKFGFQARLGNGMPGSGSRAAASCLPLLEPAKFAGQPILLHVRESTRNQKARGNLVDQTRRNKKRLSQLGYETVAVTSEVGTSSIYETRRELHRAVTVARKLGCGIVAESRDRFFRNENYNGLKITEKPSVAEFKEFQQITAGIPVFVLNEDENARSAQTIRGQREKSRLGGRPKKKTTGPGATKRRREAYQHWAKAFYSLGWTLQRIEDHFANAPIGFKPPALKTISNWIKTPLTGTAADNL